MDEKKPKSIPLADEQIQELNEKLQKEGRGSLEENSSLLGVKQNIPTPTAQVTPKKKDFVVKNLRTYQGDIAEAINRENTSVLSIALAEKKRDDEQKKTAGNNIAQNTNHKKNTILALTSLLLIILGAGAVYGFYLATKNDSSDISPAQESQTILAFNEKKDFDSKNLDRGSVITIVNSNLANWVGNSGDILYLNLFEETPNGQISVDTLGLFSKLNTNIPPSLLRAFGKRFMLGLVKESVSEPFILIEVASFENAFAGMLGWESSLYKDIGPLLLSKKIAPTVMSSQQSQQTGTSTSSSTPPLGLKIEINTSFEDITIKNKDARILKNNRNDTVLLYSFLDKNTLLITSSESVFQDLANRLISKAFLR